MTDFFEIVRALQRHNVKFVIVGGLAGVLRGVPMQTFDLDIVHQRTDENIRALLGALGDLHAYARHHPQKPAPNATHLQGDGHLLLETDYGSLDVLGSIDGGATYEDLVEHATPMDLDGHELLVLSLRHLLEVKRRAGRAKDYAVLPLIEHALALEEE